MSILDSMTRVYPERSIFIVVRKNTINLSKAAYEGLSKPDVVEIYVGGGKAALKPGDGFKFATVEPGKQNLYRISGVNMVRQVKEQVGEGRISIPSMNTMRTVLSDFADVSLLQSLPERASGRDFESLTKNEGIAK